MKTDRTKLDLRPGYTVRVWQKIKEKGKTRLQAFEGMVIGRKHGTEMGATFTVRRVASGVGMEKIFPLHSPMIDKVEIVKRAKTRRAKLYYVRSKASREVRRRMKHIGQFVFTEEELTAETVPEEKGETVVAEAIKE